MTHVQGEGCGVGFVIGLRCIGLGIGALRSVEPPPLRVRQLSPDLFAAIRRAAGVDESEFAAAFVCVPLPVPLPLLYLLLVCVPCALCCSSLDSAIRWAWCCGWLLQPELPNWFRCCCIVLMVVFVTSCCRCSRCHRVSRLLSLHLSIAVFLRLLL